MKLILLILAALCTAYAQDETHARLLVSKLILNRYLVQNQDIVVEYTIYNIGTGAATNIVLTDSGYNPEQFEVASGLVNIKVDRLAPGTNTSHAVVVIPKNYGYFNFTAAEVQYQPSEENQQVQISYSTEPGEGGVVPYKDFDRKFSPHMLDWVAFAIMTLPSLVIPLLLWYRSKVKYELTGKHGKRG